MQNQNRPITRQTTAQTAAPLQRPSLVPLVAAARTLQAAQSAAAQAAQPEEETQEIINEPTQQDDIEDPQINEEAHELNEADT